MATGIVFETHSLTDDNEAGGAIGWLPGRLSASGRVLARELGDRRRGDGLAAVFTSDLGRAVETAELAFEDGDVPVLHDWRLRECDYGELNGEAVALVHGDRHRWLKTPYPGGESWRQAIDRHGLPGRPAHPMGRPPDSGDRAHGDQVGLRVRTQRGTSRGAGR